MRIPLWLWFKAECRRQRWCWICQLLDRPVIEGVAGLQQQCKGAVHRGLHGRRRQMQDADILHVGALATPFQKGWQLLLV